MVKNKYKVPLKLWKKFKEHKSLYNDMMDQMLPNQELTVHPKTPKIPKVEWNTICHNAAVYAIWSLQKQPLSKGTVVKHVDSKTDKIIKSTKAK